MVYNIKINPLELKVGTVIRLKQIIFCGLLIFLFLNVFPHVNFVKDGALYISLLFFGILVYNKKVEFNIESPLTVPLLLFSIWAFLTSVFAQEVTHSFHSFYSHLIRYILFYYAFINIFKTKDHIVIISWIIFVSSVLFFTGGLINFYLIIGHPVTERFGFLSFSINIIGFTSIFALLLGIQLLSIQKRIELKLFLVFGIMVLILTTLMTQSRSAVISLLISSFIVFLNNKKWVFFLFVGGLILSATILPIKHRLTYDRIVEDKPRIMLLYYSMAIVLEHPIFGVGFSIDTFKNKNLINQKRYEEKVPEKYRITFYDFILPHSMPLSLLVRTGIVGLISFFLILFTLFKISIKMTIAGKDGFIKDWGRCFMSVLVMFVCSSLFEPVFIHSLDTLFYTLCGLITMLWKINEQTGLAEDSQ